MMSVECCGKPRTSRFCPDCGAKLADDDPIAWLIVHCRQQEKANRTRAENHRDRGEGEPPSRGEDRDDWRRACRMWAEDNESKAEAWKARGDALAALVRSEDVR